MSPRKQERTFEKPYAKELLAIAKGDLQTAEALKDAHPIRVENAFFLVQQSVEKGLKAVLVARGVPVPMVHDLGVLLGRLPNDLDPPHGYELADLDDYAGIRRYQEGVFEPTREELHRLLAVGQEMFDWCAGIVGSLVE